VAVDAGGNVFIGDSGNNRVRKVTPGGVISTVAGNGTAGFGGDSGTANSAQLNYPAGLAFDSAGNLYIADAHNSSIRMVDSSGRISTVVSDCGVHAGFSGDGGQAAFANVDLPLGVAVDAYGNLFIADVNNNRVRGATGLAGVRAAPCPGQSSTPAAARGANQSGGGVPGIRIPELGGSTRRFMPDTVLPGRVTSMPSQLKLVPAKKSTAAVPPAKKAQAGQAARVQAPAPLIPQRVRAQVVAPHTQAATLDSNLSYLPEVLIVLAVIGLMLIVLRRRTKRID
jgi:hypothetical protein